MRMTGEQQVAAPRQRVWAALNDPEVLRASIPGCQSLTKEADDRFAATVEVRVGPISARFNGNVTLTDLDPPSGYTLIIQGNGGIAGSMKGSARVRLTETAGGTLVAYDVDAEVGGRMAQLGGPIIDATAKQLAGKFFSRFGDIVGGGQTADAAAGAGKQDLGGVPGGTAAPATRSAAADTAVRSGSATPVAPRSSGGLPMAWVLASVVALIVGFLLGRGPEAGGSEWAGMAIGLLLIVVAAAAFEYGRRAATTVLTLDATLLRRLAGNEPGERQ